MYGSIGKTPFHVNYGFHPRGVMELRDLPNEIKVNVQGQEPSTWIKEIHDQVRDTLNKNNAKYKAQEYRKRKHLSFK